MDGLIPYAAKILLQLVEGTPSGTFGDVGLKLACGAICQETDRNDGAVRWYRHAVESALASGIVIPFLGLDIGPKSGLGLALKGVSPALFGKVKALSRSYFGNLIHFHNRYSGETLTDALTPREFYFAEALKRGLGYKTIAARMGISAGRANIMVRSIYQKLHIHSRKEISIHV